MIRARSVVLVWLFGCQGQAVIPGVDGSQTPSLPQPEEPDVPTDVDVPTDPGDTEFQYRLDVELSLENQGNTVPCNQLPSGVVWLEVWESSDALAYELLEVETAGCATSIDFILNSPVQSAEFLFRSEPSMDALPEGVPAINDAVYEGRAWYGGTPANGETIEISVVMSCVSGQLCSVAF